MAGPGETLFDETENARFSNEELRMPADKGEQDQFFVPAVQASETAELLVPAEMPAAAKPTSTTPAGRKKKAVLGKSPNKMMDDYFLEGEKKSRELDYASGGKSTPPPPPPKVGGPPQSGPPQSASPKSASPQLEGPKATSPPVEKVYTKDDDSDVD